MFSKTKMPGSSVLKEQDYVDIKKAYDSGKFSIAELSKLYDLSKTTMVEIVMRLCDYKKNPRRVKGSKEFYKKVVRKPKVIKTTRLVYTATPVLPKVVNPHLMEVDTGALSKWLLLGGVIAWGITKLIHWMQ